MRGREGTASVGSGEGTQGRNDPPALGQTCLLPLSRPVPPLLLAPSSLPPKSWSFSDLFGLTSPSPLPPPSFVTSDRGPEPQGGSGRVSPLPAPRLPLPEVFLHRRVPARLRGAPLHHRRLRGRHVIRAV